MWTLCYSGAENDDGETMDGWERWETRDDVINRANTLVNVCEDIVKQIEKRLPQSATPTAPSEREPLELS